jgi:hypothetical protein
MYGMGGQITSHGMDILATKLRGIPNTVASVFSYGEYLDIVLDIQKHPATDKSIVIGYSLGANATTNVATALGQTPVDLLVAIDPSIWGYIYPLTGNVRKAICFHNTNHINVIGLGRLSIGPAFDRRNLETIDIDQFHLAVDYNTHIHDAVANAVKAL